MSNPESFLFPSVPFGGDPTPRNVVFNANLQEFSQRVEVITALESGGKITPLEAYVQIKELWHQLRESKRGLWDDANWNQQPPDLPEQ